MRRITLIVTALAALCACAMSQTAQPPPILAGPQLVNTTRLDLFTAELAKELPAGWTGATIGGQMPDSLAGYSLHASEMVATALPLLKAGRTVLVRLPWEINPASTYWLGLAGGQAIECRTYPPPGPSNRLWLAMAKYHDLLRAKLTALCDQLGVPHSRLMFEGGNEDELGGVSGPTRQPTSQSRPALLAAYARYAAYLAGTGTYADFKTAWLAVCPSWTLNPDGSPMQTGVLPPRFFTMRVAIRKAVSYSASGCIYIGYTFEAQGNGDGDDIQRERDSWAPRAQPTDPPSPAEQLAALSNRMNRNAYASAPKSRWVLAERRRRDLTPAELAQESAAKIIGGTWNGTQYGGIAYLRQNPVLARFQLPQWGVTETNVRLNSGMVGDTQAAREANAALFRQAHVDMLATLPIGWAGIFTSTGTDATTLENPMWRWDATAKKLVPIGAEVYPRAAA